MVGYDTNGDGTFSMTEPLPSWFTGLTTRSGNGSITTTGETGVANLVPEAASTNKLAAMNAALKQNPKGSLSDYYDLSTHNIKGNVTPRNTANCYVISAPGYYKIPLVYGNAIKNGTDNASSYQTSNSFTFILQHFKDHADQAITNPWITQSNGSANVPNGAKLVWADESGLVTNLVVTGSGTNAFVQFEVPTANIKNGNAVIAVTKNNVVVWSWHLWFIHDDALNTVTCTNFEGHDYKFTQETLGWKYTAWSGTTYSAPRSVKVKVEQTAANGGVKQSAYITITQNPGNTRQGYNTLYEFGRKDALPGTDAIAQGNYSFDPAGGGRSIGYAIQHPENMFTFAGTGTTNDYDWCNATYYNLWSMGNTGIGFNDNAVVKTIYDPCPAGFHMPASHAFTGFTTDGQNGGPMNVSGAWDKGHNFNNKLSSPDATVYFPASGYRRFYDGSLLYVGNRSYYWSAVPYGESDGCYMYFAQWYANPKENVYRSYGFAVRPVADN